MKFYIHSSYGVLEATPLCVQAIEKSIPEQVIDGTNQDSEVPVNMTDDSAVSSAVATTETNP